jgi:hypothetical protein
MVSTRNHPSTFPPSEASPTKAQVAHVDACAHGRAVWAHEPERCRGKELAGARGRECAEWDCGCEWGRWEGERRVEPYCEQCDGCVDRDQLAACHL